MWGPCCWEAATPGARLFLPPSSSRGLHPAQLGDFGLAVGVEADGEPEPTGDSGVVPASPGAGDTLASSGSRVHTGGVGTGTYASPEQLEGSSYNEKVSWLCPGAGGGAVGGPSALRRLALW